MQNDKTDVQQRLEVARGVDSLLTDFSRKLQKVIDGTRTFGSITVSYRDGRVHIAKHEQHLKPFTDFNKKREPGVYFSETDSEHTGNDRAQEERDSEPASKGLPGRA